MARYTYKKQYTWSADIAYIVGLIASDGCLSKDGRHIDFTSKDLQLIETYRSIISPNSMINNKFANADRLTLYYRVQFSNTAFYDFLLSTAMTPNKSLIMPALKVPDQFFADFLRGLFDGDGCVTGFWDKRWKHSLVICTNYSSASLPFLAWLQSTIVNLVDGIGSGSVRVGMRCFQLSYGKADSWKLFQYMYYTKELPCLLRKYQRYLELFAINPYAVKE